MSGVVGLVSGIVIAILTGSIPGIDPINWIYSALFGSPIPEYLDYGFSSIGIFTLLYSAFYTLILSPIYCELGKTTSPTLTFERPSKEDLIYIPFIYITYLWTVNYYGLLTYDTAIAGIFVIMLPIIYRFVIYTLDYSMQDLTRSCYYPIYLFVASLLSLVPLTAVYLFLTESIFV